MWLKSQSYISALTQFCFCYTSLSVFPLWYCTFSFFWVLCICPPVSLRGTGYSWAVRPLGEWKGRGGVGPGNTSIPGRVERPPRGLGRSQSLLLSTRRLIGTALNSRMHGWENAQMIMHVNHHHHIFSTLLILYLDSWERWFYCIQSIRCLVYNKSFYCMSLIRWICELNQCLPQTHGCDSLTCIITILYFLLDFASHSNKIIKQGSLKAKGLCDWTLAVVITCGCTKEAWIGLCW